MTRVVCSGFSDSDSLPSWAHLVMWSVSQVWPCYKLWPRISSSLRCSHPTGSVPVPVPGPSHCPHSPADTAPSTEQPRTPGHAGLTWVGTGPGIQCHLHPDTGVLIRKSWLVRTQSWVRVTSPEDFLSPASVRTQVQELCSGYTGKERGRGFDF